MPPILLTIDGVLLLFVLPISDKMLGLELVSCDHLVDLDDDPESID